MSTTTTDLAAICRQFFDALQAHDTDTVRSLMAEDGIFTQNGGPDMPLTQWADPHVLESVAKVLGRHRYEEVRQVVGGDAVVEQHRVRSTLPSGDLFDREVCVVVRFGPDGRIIRLDEYADTSPVG